MHQSFSGCFGEEKYPLCQPGIKHSFICCPACSFVSALTTFLTTILISSFHLCIGLPSNHFCMRHSDETCLCM